MNSSRITTQWIVHGPIWSKQCNHMITRLSLKNESTFFEDDKKKIQILNQKQTAKASVMRTSGTSCFMEQSPATFKSFREDVCLNPLRSLEDLRGKWILFLISLGWTRISGRFYDSRDSVMRDHPRTTRANIVVQNEI